MSIASFREAMKARWDATSKRKVALVVIALLALPLMAVASSYAWAALAAFPDAKFTDEQLKTLAWLPVISMYAAGVIVLAVLFNSWFTYEPGHDVEQRWHEMALEGNVHARWLLVRADLRWAVLLAYVGAFFWMAR